jgi:thioester reductase-like protein
LTATNKLKVYLSGDSTTTGVGLTDTNYKLDVLLETLAVKSGMSFVDFVDKCHSGYLTSEWVTEFLTGEIGDNPDLFVLRWGINDGKYGYVNDGVFNKT